MTASDRQVDAARVLAAAYPNENRIEVLVALAVFAEASVVWPAELDAQPAPPADVARAADVEGAFADWLVEQMPPGTIISSARWWAPRITRAYDRIRRLAAGQQCQGGECGWQRYRYALALIDAAASDADGMAGVAFSAQVPVSMLEAKSASQIAEMLCENACSTTHSTGSRAYGQQCRAQPEVQEAVAWCALNASGGIAYFDGKPMIMPGQVGNEHHTTPLYTHPAPAPSSGPVVVTERMVERACVQMHGRSWQNLHPANAAEIQDEMRAALTAALRGGGGP